MNGDVVLSDHQRATLLALARPYLWWGGAQHSTRRVIAQVMNLATYDDILRLESLVPRTMLLDVIAHTEPGWFSARSWEFWRGRLRADLPDSPPLRTFADAG
jgi:hypothetical protein